jgi:hypothetical protein
LEGLSWLTVLDLSKNLIVFISPYFLKPCPGITRLFLAKNRHIGQEITLVCIQFSLSRRHDFIIVMYEGPGKCDVVGGAEFAHPCALFM